MLFIFSINLYMDCNIFFSKMTQSLSCHLMICDSIKLKCVQLLVLRFSTIKSVIKFIATHDPKAAPRLLNELQPAVRNAPSITILNLGSKHTFSPWPFRPFCDLSFIYMFSSMSMYVVCVLLYASLHHVGYGTLASENFLNVPYYTFYLLTITPRHDLVIVRVCACVCAHRPTHTCVDACVIMVLLFH